MSAAEFQKRIADLKFSAEKYLRELHKEQTDSEKDHEAWEDESDGMTDDDLVDHANNEPEIIDHSEKIAHIETAIGHLDAAVDELDGAIDED